MSQLSNPPETGPLSEGLRVLHILPSLSVGGAEQMAAHLMIGLSRSHTVGAVGLLPAANSIIERRLAKAGIRTWHLDKRAGFDPRMFSSLSRIFRKFQPEVVHTHMAVQRYVFPLLLRERVGAAFHTIHSLAEHETDAFGRLVHWFAFRHHVLPIAVSREVAASVKRVYRLRLVKRLSQIAFQSRIIAIVRLIAINGGKPTGSVRTRLYSHVSGA